MQETYNSLIKPISNVNILKARTLLLILLKVVSTQTKAESKVELAATLYLPAT